MEWSPDQATVLSGVEEWKRNPDRQYITVGGLAGTGKLTLLAHWLESWPYVGVCALSGKAASVLRSKGVWNAKTIHSLIYFAEEQADGTFKYYLREHLEEVRVIACDEASMVSLKLFQDMLSFNLPILFVGDHGQLEPIGDNPNLMKEPDFRLEKIHRQAVGSPIVEVAHAFRAGQTIDYRSLTGNGSVLFVNKSGRADYYDENIQAICGFNATRHGINKQIRAKHGRIGVVTEGERIMILKNNYEFGVFNGQQLMVRSILRASDRSTRVIAQDYDGAEYVLTLLNEQFGKNLLPYRGKDALLADYAYCITAHKSQGSEYPAVLVIEELSEIWDARRWRYTVATRARERLIYSH